MRNLKKVLSLVLAMAMSLSLAVTAGATFTDDSKISPEYATAVEFAAQTGILEGFENGSYGPQKTLTRAQLATMTYRIATGDVEDAYTADFAGGAAAAFTDTAADAWYAGYVGYAADAGYLKGVGEGLYKPNSAMTGYQALAAFLRVVGYNQPGQFTGADWTVQVAQVAYEIGALEDITGVDLNAAISREVAAQMIFNILFSDIVSYTPAFGYQNALFQDTLVEDVFGIETISYDEATAPWGQPATQWYYEDGGVAVSIPFAPVAEYTVAVNECDLAKDLGVTEEVVTDWYINGDAQDKFDDIITLKHDSVIGAQGTLTQVYEVGGAFWVVQVETFLGQIGKTTEAEFDKNGHETKAATAELDVFCSDYKLDTTLITDEFAEDDYVLVNYSFMTDEYFLEVTTPSAPATQTYVNTNEAYSVIGGETFDWAAHYEYGFYGKWAVDYYVFEDFYGNVIGIEEYVAPAAPVYTTIFESVIGVTNGYNPYNAGKIVDLTNGDLVDVTVCELDKDGEAVIYPDNKVEYKHFIAKYTECEDGIEIEEAVDVESDNYSIVKGTPRVMIDGVPYVTDAETIYAVESACGEYTIYNGYTNVPTFSSANDTVQILKGEDGIVDVVYVTDANAIYAGAEIFAYVMPAVKGTGAGALANDVRYDTYTNIVVDGAVVELKTVDGYRVDAFAGELVTLFTNTDGLIYKVEIVSDDYTDATVEAVSNEVIWLDTAANEQGYVVTADTVVWVIDNGAVEASVGTTADIEAGDVVDYALAADGVSLEFVIIWA